MVSASEENGDSLPLSIKASPQRKFPFQARDENCEERQRTGAKKLMLQMAEAATPKRMKPSMELNYPDHQDVPSRKSIRAHYENAMKLENSHQIQISGFGLLSLEEVLLPAVVKEELRSIKQLQAKAQRDDPEKVADLLKLRQAIFEAAEAGIDAGRKARAQRDLEQIERDRQWYEEERKSKEEKSLQKEELKRLRREEQIKSKHMEQERRFREQKKKLPKNIELWREVALLMTELSNLQKEEQAWQGSQNRLKEQEQEIVVMEQNKPLETTAGEVEIEPNQLKERVDSAVQVIFLCTRRVQNAVELTLNTIQESDKVRKDLYQKYRSDFQFQGYKGVKNPKELIRLLSQSQDAN
jgi:hypothetical protein